mgnify:CR=1 FL=1
MGEKKGGGGRGREGERKKKKKEEKKKKGKKSLSHSPREGVNVREPVQHLDAVVPIGRVVRFQSVHLHL